MKLRTLALIALSSLFTGCATMADVIEAKPKGTTDVYPVNADRAWEISKAVFRWEGTDTIEEHRDQSYMLTSSGMNGFTAGTLMGAWVEPVDTDHTKVTVVTKRRIATNLATTLTEGTYNRRLTQAVGIVQSGKPLPAQAPAYESQAAK